SGAVLKRHEIVVEGQADAILASISVQIVELRATNLARQCIAHINRVALRIKAATAVIDTDGDVGAWRNKGDATDEVARHLAESGVTHRASTIGGLNSVETIIDNVHIVNRIISNGESQVALIMRYRTQVRAGTGNQIHAYQLADTIGISRVEKIPNGIISGP